MTLLNGEDVNFKYHKFCFTPTPYGLKRYHRNYRTYIDSLPFVVTFTPASAGYHLNLTFGSDCCGEGHNLSMSAEWVCLKCQEEFKYLGQPLIYHEKAIWGIKQNGSQLVHPRTPGNLRFAQEDYFHVFLAENLPVESLEAIVVAQMFLYELKDAMLSSDFLASLG